MTKFVNKDMPAEMPAFTVNPGTGILDVLSGVVQFATSNSEARRIIEGGGVSLDGQKISNPQLVVKKFCGEKILKVGKRKFAKINCG